MSRPVLQVITASTRPGRRGAAVAEWIRQVAVAHQGFEVETVDLLQQALPLLDEPNHPSLQTYTQPHTLAWSRRVARADAFVIVLPEYNHSYPAALKNALDYLFVEWADKPVGMVSYGGVSAGLRAAGALKPVLLALRMVPILVAVAIPNVSDFIDEQGVFAPEERHNRGGQDMLDEILRLASVLVPLREER